MIVLIFGKRKVWGFWKWVFAALAVYMAMELATFLIAGWALKKTVGDLAGSYLAFAVPGAVMASLVWWLHTWEERGLPAKSLARGWGLSMVLFGVAIAGALLYSGVELGIVNPADARRPVIVAALCGALITYITTYRMVLPRISSRAVGKPGCN